MFKITFRISNRTSLILKEDAAGVIQYATGSTVDIAFINGIVIDLTETLIYQLIWNNPNILELKTYNAVDGNPKNFYTL